jgi:hypothetical protein
MKNTLLLIPVVALLAACGSTDPYSKRADAERERQEKYVERVIDKAPKWMVEVPTSKSAVYSAGTGSANDYSMAFKIARQDAYDKICMTAGGTASQRMKTYKTESATLSESVSRSSCKEVDITGVEVAEKKIITEGTKYRAYVLLALPTGDANVLRRAKENQKLQELAAKRSTDAFKELDN